MFDTGVSAGTSQRTEWRSVDGDCGGSDTELDAETVNTCVAGLVEYAYRTRMAENLARARVVESVCEIAELRLTEAEALGDDAAAAVHAAVCEVAVGLGTSQQVARPFLEVGWALDRLPLTAIRFVYGTLDWARVQELTSVLGKAGDATIAALEPDAVAAAERLGPRSLRLRLWRLWFVHDHAEASAAQSSAVTSARGTRVRRDPAGVSILEATLTDMEGAEAEALIEEIASTVCPQDPRSAKELRADGLMALLHSEHALECRCERAELCPQFGVADLPDGRRGPLVQVLIDVETLLGLTQTSAVLADGTPLDPELARTIAADARWQGLLIEMLDAYRAREDSTAEPDRAAERDSGSRQASDTLHLPRLIFRGRTRRAGTVPPPRDIAGSRHRTQTRAAATAPVDSTRASVVAALVAAIHADPQLGAGIHPDSHGGHAAPPPGALTYRPSAEVAARVRMTYSTCTHPGCDTPSTRCELDHIVPFDHRDPGRGGWTIDTNLHPVCTGHHQLKSSKAATVAYLRGGAILWTHRTGTRSITFPALGAPTPPRSRKRGKKQAPPDIEAPTWWEQHMPADTAEPTAAHQRAAETDAARIRIRRLRRRFREHKAIQRLRARAAPPPF